MGLFKRRKVKEKAIVTNIDDPKKDVIVPPGRKSRPVLDDYTTYEIKDSIMFVNPGYISEYIPVIRKLSWVNEDVGLALNDMVQLTNTGHRIKFDPDVSQDQQKEMRRYLKDRQKFWGDGVAGMNGLVNKMISQIWISGALSNEWVVSNDLTGISHLALVNPETIRFQWNRKKLRFSPYQKQSTNIFTNRIGDKYIKLNTNTYKYFGLNGDTDIPYGIPPFLTALNSLTTQGGMDKNIRFIISQIGLLGFLQVLMMKPSQEVGESDEHYVTRLKGILSETKDNLKDGINDGIVTGFIDDHDIQFNSTTKNISGVPSLYDQNEVKVANGLKIAPEFLGVGSSGSETGINIIFTKMLSQLQNVQKLVSANLEYGYTLELKLAGYPIKSISVEFNPSTITDELKFQQAQEYKIRNVYNKYQMGIISMQQAADELGYDKPDAKEPRGDVNKDGVAKDNRQDQNSKSDKKTREKSKPQPKKNEQK